MKGRIKKTEKELILLVYDTNFKTTEYQISSIEPSLQIEDGDCVLFDIENGFAKILGIQFTGKEMKEEIQNWSNEFDSILESHKNKNKINMQEVLDKIKLYTEDELREAILEALAYFSDSGGNRDLVIANKVIMQLNNKK